MKKIFELPYMRRRDGIFMKIRMHPLDEMTPYERKCAIEKGKPFDRFPIVPFMGELKCRISQASLWEFWHDPKKMAETEIAAFNRFGYDRMLLGPNSYGIAEALGARVIYPEGGLPYTCLPEKGAAVSASGHGDDRIRPFREAAELLAEAARELVPVEMSIGGPFTIASYLRGTETLLRDCVKKKEQVHKLLARITESQKSCIRMAAVYGFGIAMADPVANPELIGPKLYESFVFPYTLELTEYAREMTGKRVSLHMCGKTYRIWDYFRRLPLGEVSLDNAVSLERAVAELSDAVPVAGNVPPVDVVMAGTRDEIFRSVKACAEAGAHAKKGYVLATGCEIPVQTALSQVDIFMEAARLYGKRKA